MLDQAVLGLDESVELLAELGLDAATQGAECEGMARARCRRCAVLVRTDGECSIPGGSALASSHRRYPERKSPNKCIKDVPFLFSLEREFSRDNIHGCGMLADFTWKEVLTFCLV